MSNNCLLVAGLLTAPQAALEGRRFRRGQETRAEQGLALDLSWTCLRLVLDLSWTCLGLVFCSTVWAEPSG
jgi:hypothetical protein